MLWAVVVLWAGCESGSASEQIEDYDADRGFRFLKHVRDLDFSWVNTRMQQIVVVEIPRRRRLGGIVACTGVLVGEDLVLTAAHCVSRTDYLRSDCTGRRRASTLDTFGNIVLDVQLVQDSSAGTDFTGTEPRPLSGRHRAPTTVGITEMVAWTNLAFRRVDPADVTSPCDADASRAGLDAVILRLAEPVGAARGYARLRAEPPAVGAVLPVIHHPSAAAKQITVLRVMDRDALGVGADVLRDGIMVFDAPIVPAMLATQTGSSGAPLFDVDGYVLGTLSQGCDDLIGIPPCAVFSNMAVLLREPGFAGIRAATERSSDSGLGRFDVPVLGDFQLERAGALDGIDRPLGLTARPEGGFLTAGFSTDDDERFFALVAYHESGALDTAFGSAGAAIHDVPRSSNEQLYDVVYADVGGTPVAFAVGSLGDPESMALARFTADGSLDPSFATGGVMRISGGPPGAPAPTSGAAIAVDPRDGTLVVAGHAGIDRAAAGGTLHGSPVVARFDTDGNPDPRCGDSGLFTWRPSVPDPFAVPAELTAQTIARAIENFQAPTYDMVVTDMTVDDAGRIVLVGYMHRLDFHARVPWVGRLNADCSPDETFGITGSGVVVVSTDPFAIEPAAENGWLSAVLIEPTTNRIFVGGTITAFDPSLGFFTGRMFVAALLPDGSLDRTGFGFFGGEGGAVLFSEGWHDELHGLAYLAGEGDEARLILAGESYRDARRTTRRVRMASFFLDGFLDELAYPINTAASGIVDAWATDVVVTTGGDVFVSVAHRSGDPFDPDPLPFP